MKKIGLSVLLAAIITSCGLSQYAVDIAHGISDMGRGQTLILLLITLIIVVLLGSAVYLIVRRLIRIHHTYRQLTTGSTGR